MDTIPTQQPDRRRHQRMQMKAPLRGRIDGIPVVALDASTGGVRLGHVEALPEPGTFCRLSLETEFGELKLDCEVLRTVTGPRQMESALAIVAADRQSIQRLHAILPPDKSR